MKTVHNVYFIASNNMLCQSICSTSEGIHYVVTQIYLHELLTLSNLDVEILSKKYYKYCDHMIVE